jgi:hypothetical protein
MMTHLLVDDTTDNRRPSTVDNLSNYHNSNGHCLQDLLSSKIQGSMSRLTIFYVLLLPCIASAFTSNKHPVPQFASSRKAYQPTTLFMTDVSVTTPSPDAAADMGIRDWPQQLKKGSWTDASGPGQMLVRYVLDGTGTVEIVTIHDSITKLSTVGPGTLIEVTGEAKLSWEASSSEMILLTPGFEEGGKLLGVAALMVIVCGALIAGVGS